jgi:hypothetical protein
VRATLALSVILLALTLALNGSRALFSGAQPEPRLADRALEIVAGAKGPMLPLARIGSGPERIGEAIRLGDRTLVGTGSQGLRAAFLAPDFGLRAEQCFDVARSEDDARALREAVEDSGNGTILVLASSGRLARDGPGDPSPELERTLALLGARARPGAATPESWALLALRLDRGWIPLAEGYSRDSGVALAFVLSPELESYADFRGDFARMRAGERDEVDLEAELEHATLRTGGIQRARPARVQGQPMTGIRLPPDGRSGARGRLAWSGVPLGAESWLIAWLGLEDGASAGSDGVALEVRVDGELVARGRRVVQPGVRWRRLEIDLAAFAGRRVELELDVDPLESATGDALLLGWPKLLHGYSRPPSQVWMEER